MEEKVILSEMTKKDKAYKAGGFFLGIILLYSFTTDMHWGKLIMAILFILVSGYHKEMTVKKDGIEYNYRYFFVKRYDKLPFNKLDEVVVVKHHARNLVYFVKGQTTEKLSMPEDKLNELIGFIEKHSDVKIREEKIL